MLVRALIAAHDGRQQRRIRRLLQRDDVVVGTVSGRAKLMQRLDREPWDVVLVDDELLAATPVPELRASADVIVLARDTDDVDQAGFLGEGCLAVLNVTLDDEPLRDALAGVLDRLRDRAHERITAETLVLRNDLDDFSTQSEEMRSLLKLARKVAKASTTTLIVGETGVGKEWLARAIHAESPRQGAPFVAVNCAALPEGLLESELFGHEEGAFTGATRLRRGKFELAHLGTLFLDEIGEMPLQMQTKLLRALQEKEIVRVGGETPIGVDVRIMVATNRDLEREIEEGRFRADLFYRISVVTLPVPPLRNRVEDIETLANAHLARFRSQLGSEVTGFDPAVLEAFARYPWPGNVREIINVIERAVLLVEEDRITLDDLPAQVAGFDRISTGSDDSTPAPGGWVARGLDLDTARREVLERFERAYLEETLRAAQGKIGQAAAVAGVNPRSLYDKLRRHGLRKEDFRPTR